MTIKNALTNVEFRIVTSGSDRKYNVHAVITQTEHSHYRPPVLRTQHRISGSGRTIEDAMLDMVLHAWEDGLRASRET